MAVQRVALIYDDVLRPETTGGYCLRALQQLAEVEHVLPARLNALSMERYDLLLQIDDGLDYRLPAATTPSAVWVIDTHVDFASAKRKAEAVDFVFAAQKDGAERLQEHGIVAEWLPLACDPELHRPHDVPTEHDVCFIGNLFPGPRNELLERIRQRVPRTFIGRRFFHEMARTYSASKIAFNRSLKDDVNMRVFEAMACGALLLTNDLSDNGQAELFNDGVHLATYRDEIELFEKLQWLLKDDDARVRIAKAGRAEVLRRHTYRHRMQQILQAVSPGPATAVALASPVPSSSLPAPVAGKDSPMTEENSVKDPSYFQHARPELLKRVPQNAQRVLDVGCGGGRLGAALKQRQPCEVWGVERDPAAARAAEALLDRVLCGDAELVDDELGPATFDAVVCGDLLEHLRDPLAFLRKVRGWLEADGVLVASIPNVRHHSVLRSLLEGNWTYEPAGLLDDDHVRFFTRREIEKLLFRAGFALQTTEIVPGPGSAEWVQAGRPSDVRIGGLAYRARDERDAEELFAYQYLVEATPRPLPDDGPTSIVIVTHNQLPHTRACVESVRQFTDEPYELIFVDNGSTDGTPEYLDAIPGATVVRNETNRGFPAAVNQGIEAAGGDQILLLNNDTIATTGWLRRMLDALHREPDAGLVGPLSNNVSGEQQISVDYDDLAALDGFAWELGRRNAQQIQETDRLVGFCLLIRRRVIDAVGGLDESFGIGNFEDDDFCRRAQKAGFRAVVAKDAFVHHVGGATFRASEIDFAALMEENRRKFDEKWNGATGAEGPGIRAGESEQRSETAAVAAEPLRGLRLAEVDSRGLALDPGPSTLRLSLCLIVRDNEGTIGPALESIKPWVDEMIVVDTGSTDRTPEICRKLGARVEFFEWCDDFSAARNESLKYAQGEWIFWMDSDDTIPEECGRTLRELADGEHKANVLGYVMQVHCPSAGDVHDVTVVDHVKLFRNRPELRFEHRIHEQILPAIRRNGGEVEFTDVYVVHSGSDQTPEGRKRKLERDYRLLKLDLQERPDHPFVLFNLGMTYDDDGRHELAVQFLQRCLKVSQPHESHVRKAYALLVNSLAKSDRWDEAQTACDQGLERFPDDKELLFRRAILHQQAGRLQEAVDCYRRVLDESTGRGFASMDSGLAGFKARHNLALVYEQLEWVDEAEAEWQTVTQEHPEFRPAWRGLVELILQRNDAAAAEELTARMGQCETLAGEAAVFRARLLERNGDGGAAERELRAVIERRPDDVEPLRELGRLLFESGGPAAAEDVLQRLAALDPADPATLHNLGNVYLATGRVADAVRSLHRSLELRPDARETRRLLDAAQDELAGGRNGESRATDPVDGVGVSRVA